MAPSGAGCSGAAAESKQGLSSPGLAGSVAPSAAASHSLTHPGRGDVHHHLLEGGRLLGLSLGVQRDLLAKLSRVRRAGSRARSGSGSGSTAA